MRRLRPRGVGSSAGDTLTTPGKVKFFNDTKGYVAGKGWIPADTASDIGAGVIAILAAIWSWQTNTPGKTIK